MHGLAWTTRGCLLVALAVVVVAPSHEALPDSAVGDLNGRIVSAKQREQLLQLKGIVENALKDAKSGRQPHGGSHAASIDGDEEEEEQLFAHGEKAWNSTAGTVAEIWWKSRKFRIASITAAALCFVLLFLIFFFYSPLYSYVLSRCQGEGQQARKVNYEELPSGGDTLKDLRFDDSPTYGTIRYLMHYDSQNELLQVTLKNCLDLPKGSSGSLDPYVLIRVTYKQERRGHPSCKEVSLSTRVTRNSLNPEFNCTGRLDVLQANLPYVVVHLEIYDWSSSPMHPMVARQIHALQDDTDGHDVEEILNRDSEFEKQLMKGRPMQDTGGDVCVTLQLGPPGEPLRVKIIECKGIYLRDSRGQVDEETLPNTYMDILLWDPQGCSHKRRTNMVYKCRNPYFNEEFTFNVPDEKLHYCALRLTLVHISDILRIRKVVGSVELSANVEDNPLAREHWMAVSQPSSKAQISMCYWHYLITPNEMEKLLRTRSVREQKRQQRHKEKQAEKEAEKQAEKEAEKQAGQEDEEEEQGAKHQIYSHDADGDEAKEED